MNTIPIRIVIPDAGPLITLAKLNALELLLVFDDSVRIVITDYVEFEVTRNRHLYPDAAVIANFIQRNAGVIEIEATDLGRLYKSNAMLRDRLESDPCLAASLGVDIVVPNDPGEMTIVQYVRSLVDKPPGEPVLIIAEDDYFLRDPSAVPGNAHLVSTRTFLSEIEKIAKVPGKKALWSVLERMREGAGKALEIDIPAKKINTAWLMTLSDKKINKIIPKIKR